MANPLQSFTPLRNRIPLVPYVFVCFTWRRNPCPSSCCSRSCFFRSMWLSIPTIAFYLLYLFWTLLGALCPPDELYAQMLTYKAVSESWPMLSPTRPLWEAAGVPPSVLAILKSAFSLWCSILWLLEACASCLLVWSFQALQAAVSVTVWLK